ncbi:heme-dependent oxidative N-demethylase subunit alpha family protein [Novosphingobium sp.]|uniref:heme-dependent oxidative N-demethylase subunit alpha family protein n=1 Tax=Novosphingobium sp. TaxID=1874826 RepID=UPI002620F586|nr:heme-dependent oxidative N-demethylase subunit alpha family protein [Novosphingobium sp.]
MAFGFSVEALLPTARVSGPLRMGLGRITEAEWRDPAPDVAARTAVFAAHPEAVQVLPGSEDAIAELGEVVGVSGDLATIASATHEDWCLLTQAEPGGSFVLVAGAVGYPTDWQVADKMGKPVHAVHQPTHGYAERLATSVDRFMDGLAPRDLFGRTNMFVLASSAHRYMPTVPMAERFAHVTADNAGETLYVRCERETLRRLPRSGAIVFGIGIYRAPLGTLSDENLARVAKSLTGFMPGEDERRGVPHYAAAAAGYISRRLGTEVAA